MNHVHQALKDDLDERLRVFDEIMDEIDVYTILQRDIERFREAV